MLLDLNQTTFKEKVLNGQTRILVDFWAPWCRPCYALEPILENISEDYYGELSVYKLNVEHEEQLSNDFDIDHIPTLALFENGQLVKTLPGLQSEKTIKAWLDI